MTVMAMTLRLDDELDAKVTELARREHLSKQQLVVRATEAYVARERRTAQIRTLAAQAAADYPETLRRLGE